MKFTLIVLTLRAFLKKVNFHTLRMNILPKLTTSKGTLNTSKNKVLDVVVVAENKKDVSQFTVKMSISTGISQ